MLQCDKNKHNIHTRVLSRILSLGGGGGGGELKLCIKKPLNSIIDDSKVSYGNKKNKVLDLPRHVVGH